MRGRYRRPRREPLRNSCSIAACEPSQSVLRDTLHPRFPLARLCFSVPCLSSASLFLCCPSIPSAPLPLLPPTTKTTAGRGVHRIRSCDRAPPASPLQSERRASSRSHAHLGAPLRLCTLCGNSARRAATAGQGASRSRSTRRRPPASAAESGPQGSSHSGIALRVPRASIHQPTLAHPQEERHRPLVDQVHIHRRREPAGLDRQAGGLQLRRHTEV